MELMLANHPLDCPTCDKGGECDLQDVAFLSRKDSSPMEEPKRRFPTTPQSTFDEKQIGPLVYLTMNRCIVCFKCVRFTSEIACEGDLGAFERGGHTNIAAGIGEAVKNEFSGNTIEICPVGALTSKPFRYKIRTWLTQKKASICNYCSDGCNLTLWVANNKIHRATSRRNDAVDEGWICDKGRFGVDIVNHPKRITAPLLAKSGQKLEISWDEAYEFAGRNLKAIKEKYGASAIAAVGSAHCSNEDNYILQKFFRSVIGTNHVDHRVYHKNPVSSNHGMTNSILDIEETDLIVVLGCDLTVEHPIIGLRVKKAVTKLGKKLVVANHWATKIGKFAAQQITYRFGSEVAFLNSLANQIVENGSSHKSRISPDYQAWVKNYSSAKSSQDCGISALEIESFAKIIGDVKSCIILMGRDVITHPHHHDVLQAASNLADITGLAGKEYSGLNLLWEYANSNGASDMGVLPDRLPGQVLLSDTGYRNKLEQAWKAKLPERTGYSFKGILEAIDQGEIKCLYVMQEDLLNNFPDREFVRRVLPKLEFLVVQTTLPSEVTDLAHLVLPGASFAEKEGTFTSVEGRVQKTQASLKPLGNAKPDWQIFNDLSLWMQGPFYYYSLQEISEEIGNLVPGYQGRRYHKLTFQGERKDSETGSIPFASELKKVDYQAITVPEKYPFILLTGDLVHNSGANSSWSINLRELAGEAFCEINLEDSDRLQVENGDWVLVESAKGNLRLKARVSVRLLPGTVFIPLNFPETPANFLMDKDASADFVKISKLTD
jgi:NADH-quinone oxidoreductase chain G